MKVWAFCHVRNEAALMPWFLRHYAAFCDRIHVFDDGSTDGTCEIVQAHPKATLHSVETGGLNEGILLDLAHEKIKMAAGSADYVIWADCDELVYHPNIIECLKRFQQSGYAVCRTLGFNMMSAPLPVDDGVSQLTDIYRTGVRAPVYSKPIVVAPDARFQWTAGKHRVHDEDGVRISPLYAEYGPDPWRLRLLHYRYLTPEYCRTRNARQYDRSPAKDTAWSCAPTHTGEHSPEWVERTTHLVRDVVRDDAHYLRPPLDA